MYRYVNTQTFAITHCTWKWQLSRSPEAIKLDTCQYKGIDINLGTHYELYLERGWCSFSLSLGTRVLSRVIPHSPRQRSPKSYSCSRVLCMPHPDVGMMGWSCHRIPDRSEQCHMASLHMASILSHLSLDLWGIWCFECNVHVYYGIVRHDVSKR